MPDELETFLTDLDQEVRATAVAVGTFTRTALVENLVRRLVEAEELQDWTPAFYEGRGKRRKVLAVDGYCFDELDLDGTLQLIVAEVKDDPGVQTLATKDVNGAFGRILAFFSEALSGNLHPDLEPSTPAADLARLIYESKDRLKTVRILLISNAALGSRYQMEDQSLVESVKPELHVWDLVRFQRLADVGGREEIDIDIDQMVPGGLPALSAGIGDAKYKAYLCVVPGAFLADAYEQFGSRILEGNVRAFLSSRVKVNQGIRKTILTQPDRFFAFNNGITATASRVEFGSNGNITRISDLQVVNGGQTTVSLFNTRLTEKEKATLDKIYVQMKLSVLPQDEAISMIPEISRYANTQNKVSEADLFANHPFNRKVEELSRRIWAPPRSGTTQSTRWFYERARAQYQTEQIKFTTAGKKKAFLIQNPKSQVITKTDLAKYENSYNKFPHVVSLGAQKNFVKYAEGICVAFDASPDNFNERWFHHLAAKAILFAETERIVSGASWYNNAYRANIVTYAIAKLVLQIEKLSRNVCLDLDLIWKNQGITDAVIIQLGKTAKASFDVLVDPPQMGANVTEWAKRKECWDRIAEKSVPLDSGFIRLLKERGEEQDDRRRARGDQREDTTVNAVLEVIKRGNAGFWIRALEWRNVKRLLTPTEFGILQTAVDRGSSWIPSDAQAKRLLGAANKLEADGLI